MKKQFYVENRRRTAAHMNEGDVMLFFSGEGVRKTADENYPVRFRKGQKTAKRTLQIE
jgi:hypothetical protein